MAVYGGTPGGVTAAVQAARLGKSATLIPFNGFAGGMTTGGLTATDLGAKDSIGGMALEFYGRVGAMRGFSPSKAEAMYLAKLEEAGVKLLLNRPLISAKNESGRILSIDLQTGETVRAKMFVDATYEGDLFAAPMSPAKWGASPLRRMESRWADNGNRPTPWRR